MGAIFAQDVPVTQVKAGDFHRNVRCFNRRPSQKRVRTSRSRRG
jgi:hypothetical protein